jgi:hypothetical protein
VGGGEGGLGGVGGLGGLNLVSEKTNASLGKNGDSEGMSAAWVRARQLTCPPRRSRRS